MYAAVLLALAAAPRVPDVALPDAAGQRHAPADWRGSKAVVLFFLNTECPVSNGYAPEMARVARPGGRHGFRAGAGALHDDQSGEQDPDPVGPLRVAVRVLLHRPQLLDYERDMLADLQQSQ